VSYQGDDGAARVIEVWVVEDGQRRRAYTYAELAAMSGRAAHTLRSRAHRELIPAVDRIAGIIPVFYPEQFGITEARP